MSEKTAGRAPGDPGQSQGFAGALLIIQVLLYGAAHVSLFGVPRWNEWSDQSFWVALVLGCLGVPVVARRSWGTAGMLGTVSIAAIVIWPCLWSEWSGAGARVLAFVVLVGGIWGFLWFGLQLSGRTGASLFLACMLVGGIAVGIDALYIKSVRLFAVLLAWLVFIRIATWFFRARSLEPVLFLFVGTIGLTLVLASWLHTVPGQRPFTMAYIAVVVVPLSAWITEIPIVAARPPVLRVGVQILLAGALLALAFFPLLQTWITGGFDFVGP